jgi:hypothetical protein
VESDNVTVTEPINDPKAPGDMLGVDATRVYVPLATELWLYPYATAMALTVVVVVSVNGPVYGVEAVVGVVPLVV